MMDLTELKQKQAFICDMDGVIYHGNNLLPGVHEFIGWLEENHKQFIFLTNSSERAPRESVSYTHLPRRLVSPKRSKSAF